MGLLELLAVKYKLYKKLSKSSVALGATSSLGPTVPLHPPSTPPKPTAGSSRSSLMPQRSRVATVTTSLSSFNPFSPQKKKKVERDPSAYTTQDSAINSKTYGVRMTPSRSPSPTSPTFNRLQLPDDNKAPTPVAISRARKRLRGEPVSPSPRKPKVPRTSTQAQLPIPKLNISPSDSDAGEQDEAPLAIIAKSPTKPSTGKAFKFLFEDAVEPNASPVMDKMSQSQPLPTGGLFSVFMNDDLENTRKAKKAKVVAEIGETDNMEPHIALPGLDSTQPYPPTKRPAPQITSTAPGANVKRVQPTLAPVPGPSHTTVVSNKNATTPPRKEGPKGKKSRPLKGRAAGKAGHNHGDETDDDEMNPIKDNVKVIDRPRFLRTTPVDDESGQDLDPIFSFPHRGMPHGEQPPALDIDLHNARPTQQVDLPERLLRVLALESVEMEAQKIDEEKVVQNLMYGRRLGHYDPGKGGEIWDVGEDEAGDVISSRPEEDDWEGEPIPWAVGEL